MQYKAITISTVETDSYLEELLNGMANKLYHLERTIETDYHRRTETITLIFRKGFHENK